MTAAIINTPELLLLPDFPARSKSSSRAPYRLVLAVLTVGLVVCLLGLVFMMDSMAARHSTAASHFGTGALIVNATVTPALPAHMTATPATVTPVASSTTP